VGRLRPTGEARRSLPEGEHEHSHDGHDVGSNLRVESTDEGHVVIADLPGFETEETDLRYADGTLHIDATHEVDDGEYARSRRARESVSVAGDVRTDDIEATYRNGVLEVRMPVESDGDDAHRIDIEWAATEDDTGPNPRFEPRRIRPRFDASRARGYRFPSDTRPFARPIPDDHALPAGGRPYPDRRVGSRLVGIPTVGGCHIDVPVVTPSGNEPCRTRPPNGERPRRRTPTTPTR
jgi:HSP20 family protein